MTERIYYSDSYLRQFTAKVVSLDQTNKEFEVVLDRTAFYPTSGGQPHGLGSIQDSLVRDVQENERGEVVHRVNRHVEPGIVECTIDWTRRFDHMQQHTGQHILSQAFLRTSGLNTVSFHMSADYATIDLDTESINKEQLVRAEDLANAVLTENRPVKARIVSPEAVPELSLRRQSRVWVNCELLRLRISICLPVAGPMSNSLGKLVPPLFANWTG